MQVNAYANLTTQKLSSAVSSSSPIAIPQLVQGDTIRMGLRFTENVEGSIVETQRNVVSLKASIGFPDTPPTAGSFVLRLGAGPYVEGVNQTVPLAFNATTAAIDAALTTIGVTNAALISREGSWILSNNGAQIADLTGASLVGSAGLFPLSMVRVREIEEDGEFSYDIRLLQSPLASTSIFTEIVPPPPSVTEVQEGGESGTTVWPEIQALALPPAFRGVYQIRRGFKRTVELSLEDGPEEIQSALAALADEDGTFRVTNPAANIAHIFFEGSMIGLPQDELEITVFAAPQGDATFTLELNTMEMAAALRGTTEKTPIKPIFEIEVVLEDENDALIERTYTVHRAPVTIVKEINWDGLEAAAAIDWLRPPHGQSYVPFTIDQIINGTRNYVAPFGDGVATSFVLTHNLASLEYLPPAIIDNSNGALLVHGVDYTITAATSNTITVVTLDVTPWPTNGLKLILGLAGPASAFQAHTHTIAQVVGLQTIIDDLGTRVTDLETLLPAFASADVASTEPQVIAEWKLPTLFEAYPTRQTIDAKDVPSIVEADLPRAGGLLPAAYFTGTPTDTAIIPASPSTSVVYRNTEAGGLLLPGYLGRRAVTLEEFAHFAYDGRGFYAVEKVVAADNVYYPVDFVRELFRIHVGEKQLRLGKSLVLDFAVIAAVFKSNVSAQWGVILDIGLPTAEGVASTNLLDLTYLAPSLDQAFIVTPVPSSHAFGLRITRKMVALVDTILVDKVTYGSLEATTTGLSIPAANFVVRARLHRFDTQDNKTDPRGLIAFNGLDKVLGDTAPDGIGLATIK